MIKHVVCHRYRDRAEAHKVSAMLGALVGADPSLRTMETGVEFRKAPRSYQRVTIASVDDRAGLEAYQNHPAHAKVREYIHTVLESSVSVDYEA